MNKEDIFDFIRDNDINQVKLLVDNGADVNCKNNEGKKSTRLFE